MYRKAQRLSEAIASLLAIAGGGVLLAITVLTCLSIVGRSLAPLDIGLRQISGIYDLTEIGMAVIVFAFLPWTQIRGEHARVDLFAQALAGRPNRVLDFVFDAMMLLAMTALTHRLFVGMLDKHSFGETTLIAQIPVWQGYAACMAGAIGSVFVAAFCTTRSLRRLIGWQGDGETS